MALDFYEIDDIRLTKKLFSLGDKELGIMDEIFVEFQKLTGNFVNPYGTTRIYQAHVELILSIIKDRLNRNLGKDSKQNFSQIATELSKSKNGLLAIGD